MARILIIGAAGYVGSSTSVALLDAGHEVWGLDNLTTGHLELFHGQKFFFGNAGDSKLIKVICNQAKKVGGIDCVMHFAAKNLVGESVLKPDEYYENNVIQTQSLLKALEEENVKKFIFSSTCAIFGDPGNQPIDENLKKNPLSPYGKNKLEVEQHLEKLAQEKQFQAIALRYFNAAGAEIQNRVGEWHENESHLIPRILQLASVDAACEVYGTDYPTKDGTCIRDYVHVSDLANAHILAMERLLEIPSSASGMFETFNLGSEKGFSVKEVIQSSSDIIHKKIKIIEMPRRSGDSSSLVASSKKAKTVLGWIPQKTNLEHIIFTAWEWEKKRSQIKRKAVFLDRDGTINDDPGYLRHPSQMKLLPQVGEALSILKKMGYLLIVVSNQSGVARGFIEKDTLPIIHEVLDQLLFTWGVKLSSYQLCMHHPDEKCICRKPHPHLILEAAQKFNIDLSKSYMVGDRLSDVEAGNQAGCALSFLVKTGDGLKSEALLKNSHSFNVKTLDSLFDVACWIQDQENVNS